MKSVVTTVIILSSVLLISSACGSEITFTNGRNVTGEVSFVTCDNLKIKLSSGLINVSREEIELASYLQLVEEKQEESISSNNMICAALPTSSGYYAIMYETNQMYCARRIVTLKSSDIKLSFKKVFAKTITPQRLKELLHERIHGAIQTTSTLPKPKLESSLLGAGSTNIIGRYGTPNRVEVMNGYSNFVFLVPPYRITAAMFDEIAEVIVYEKPGRYRNDELTGAEMEAILSRNGGSSSWKYFESFQKLMNEERETKRVDLVDQFFHEKRWKRSDGSEAVYLKTDDCMIIALAWYWASEEYIKKEKLNKL